MSPGLLTSLTQGELLAVVCQYTAEFAEGNNLTKMPDLSDDTIIGNINAAAKWIKCMYSDDDGVRQDRTLHPMLSAPLADRRKWTQKRELRMPITGPMFTVMQIMITQANHTLTHLQHPQGICSI
jgi:hypothetical protein